MSHIENQLLPGERLIATAEIHVLYQIFRCFFPLILGFTPELALTDKRLLGIKGFIKKDSVDQMLSKSEGVLVKQSFWGRIFNYGTVTVTTGGVIHEFGMIVQPNVFKKAVAEQVVHIQNSSQTKSFQKTESISQQSKSDIDQLMKLAELKEKGLITEEEFNAQKSKYLQ